MPGKAAVVLTIVTDTEVTAHVISDEVKTAVLTDQRGVQETFWLIKQQITKQPQILPTKEWVAPTTSKSSRTTPKQTKQEKRDHYNELKDTIKELIEEAGDKGFPAKELAPTIRGLGLYPEGIRIPIGSALQELYAKYIKIKQVGEHKTYHLK